MPADKLVCVMTTSDAQVFFKQNDIFDGVPIVADSFFSPQHNLVVFASQPLDAPYKDHLRATGFLWDAGIGRDECLRRGYRPERNVHQFQSWNAQTHALVLKVLEDDVEMASVAHCCIPQILIGAGVLPRHVALPDWLQSGLGSFMQTPPNSLWRNFGGLHWAHLLAFQDLRNTDAFKNNDDKLLRSIVTNEFFTDKKTPSKEAQASAWALTYFLAQRKLKNLEAYYAQLRRLPRDLEMEGDVLLDTFARAMGCYDTANNRRDDAKLAQLAEDFVRYFKDEVTLDNDARPMLEEIHKLQGELAKELADANKPKPATGGWGGFPGLPGGPGGFPMPMGGLPMPMGAPGGAPLPIPGGSTLPPPR